MFGFAARLGSRSKTLAKRPEQPFTKRKRLLVIMSQ